MSENIHLEILSVDDLHVPERLAAIGRVLDGFPELAPTKMGPRDPPRTAVMSVERQLLDWAPRIHPGDYFTQLMARPSAPRTYGALQITGDIWNYPPIGPHMLEFGVEEDWLREAANADRFASLFREECEAMGAFWGGAGITSLRRQTNDFVFRAQVDGTLVLPGMPGTGWDIRERALPDIFWLNYFGPATLALWGEERTRGPGVRQERTRDGGLVVWATYTPFTYDPTATRMTDYAWKLPFYEALGWDTVLHESWSDPSPGTRVPSYADLHSPRR